MKKRIFAVIIAFVFGLAIAVPAFAAESATLPRVVDDADLLSNSEEENLLDKLDEISEAYEADVVIVTAESIDNYSPMEYADDFFDYNGYGMGDDRSGVLLLINMEERDWWISTSGMCIDAFTDSDIETIGELMSSDLSDGDYADAFETFSEECEYYINGYINGFPFNAVKSLIISVVIGIIAAFIVTSVMKGQLKSVRPQPAAANYVKNGSMNVTGARELFLYRLIDRREKPKNNGSGTHRSSSGRSHGGGGGKF